MRGGGGQHQRVLQGGGRLEEPVHNEALVGLPNGEAGTDEPGVATAQELGARVGLVTELGGDAQDLATGLLGDAVGAVESRRDGGDGATGTFGDGPDRDPPASSSRSFHGRRLPFHAVVPHGSARSAGSGVHPWTPVEHILSDNTGEHEALLREVIRPHTSLLSGQRRSDIFL